MIHVRAPRSTLTAMLTESRSIGEFTAMVATWPFLSMLPGGDRHPVLVFPPYGTSDSATVPLRTFLSTKGYHVQGWGLGTNRGQIDEHTGASAAGLLALYARSGRAVSLIGWSAGGIVARRLARRHPEVVRQVITLASPFSGRPGEERPLPVPSTAVYTRTDAVTDWRVCRQPSGPERESVEIDSSHVGIAVHPACLVVIADRLARPEGDWKPFRPPLFTHHLFPRRRP